MDTPERIFDFAVEQRDIPRPGGRPLVALNPRRTQIGVLHTTEGSSLERAFTTLREKFSPPHFIVGEGRIIQCRPLNVQAAALAGNGPCFANAQAAVQIEMVGFTGGGRDSTTTTNPWIPKDDVLLPTVAIMAFCADPANGIDIPLQVPKEEWKDDASDMPLPWATGRNTRRLAAAAGDFPRLKGWWMHVEIPCQGPNFHHDCGRLKRRDMLKLAQALLDG
ncbi:MAG: hypothetical protein AABN34_23925 [Acidobacteriota bacterium]